MMKKLPIVFAIPAIAIIVIVAVAAAVKFGQKPVDEAPVTSVKLLPSSLTQTSGGQASGGFGTELKTVGTADLSHDLTTTIDDGGQSDLDSLAKEASGL